MPPTFLSRNDKDSRLPKPFPTCRALRGLIYYKYITHPAEVKFFFSVQVRFVMIGPELGYFPALGDGLF